MSALAPAPKPLRSAQILSVVTVVGPHTEASAAASALAAMRHALVALEMPFELIAVLNGAQPATTKRLRELAQEVSDLQFYPLQYSVDLTTATLAGVESAVGDWVATCDLQADTAESLVALLSATLASGSEVGLGRAPKRRGGRALSTTLASGLYHRLFRTIHRFSLQDSAGSLRIMSRAVANAILEHDAPLVAWDTLAALPGYAQTVVEAPARAQPRQPLRDVVRARWRVLLGLNAAPLRLANALCGVAALLAALYCLYVVITYAFRDDVVPGWTTMSLVLSCLFFLTSVVLGLLSEYMILLLDGAARRPRYRTAEEFSSRRQGRRHFFDVKNGERD